MEIQLSEKTRNCQVALDCVFAEILGKDRNQRNVELGASRKVNYETKKEIIGLITWAIEEMSKQKDLEILEVNKKVAEIMSKSNSYIKKIDSFSNYCIKLLESIQAFEEKSSKNIRDTQELLFMPKEEAIYVVTKYIHRSGFQFLKNECREKYKYDYFKMNKQWSQDFQEALCSIAYYEKQLQSHLNKPNLSIAAVDAKLLWEGAKTKFEHLFSLYGDKGEYFFLKNYEEEFDNKLKNLSNKYSSMESKCKNIEEENQKTIEFNSLDHNNCIYFASTYGKWMNVIIFNVISKLQVLKTIDFKEMTHSLGFLIKLPNFKLFSGGKSNYILDITNFSIKKIQSLFIHDFIGGIYHENFIYLFGRDLRDTRGYKYDLVKAKWTELGRLPKDLFGCSCVIYGNSVLIAGLSHGIFHKFDFNIESFSEIKSNNLTSGPKLFLSTDSKIFLIDNYKLIYEMQENEYNWQAICNCKLKSSSQVFCTWKEDIIYFGLLHKDEIVYYKFNLEDKTLTKDQLI